MFLLKKRVKTQWIDNMLLTYLGQTWLMSSINLLLKFKTLALGRKQSN